MFTKRDRTARLNRLAILLSQHPHGLTVREVARRLDVTPRTAYRDLQTLADELKLPVWEENGRRGILPSAFLPPLNLSMLEAVTLFLSARLMARYADRKSPPVLSAFGKLAGVLPLPMAQHVHATIAAMADQPEDETHARVFELLATGWAEGRKVRIWYPYAKPDGTVYVNERVVAPYYLEPNLSGHGCYLIAHDSYSQQIRTFKVERIRQAELTGEAFEVPEGFDATARFTHAWGVVDADLVEVRLLFHDPAASNRARETRWHPSQQETERADGKLELGFTVGGLLEITPWVLSWGDAVEVLDPPELRERVAAVAGAVAERYRAGGVLTA